MTRLDLELSTRDISALQKLARDHYGDDTEASVNRVITAALAMRLIWLSVAGPPAERTHEPVLDWSEEESLADESLSQAVSEWLFEGSG